MTERNDITFEIVEHIGVIKENPTGWKMELNVVAWNGGTPRFDIREWSPDHEHMSRGLTLGNREMNQLRGLMNERDGKMDLMPRESRSNEFMER